MSGKKSRDKGQRGERNLVNELTAKGIPSERIPLSGAAGGSFGGDLMIGSEGYRGEVKVRATGFKFLYDNLEGVDFLFVKQDRADYLAVMRLEDFQRLMLNEEKEYRTTTPTKSYEN